jgi:hypothetical protein
VADARGARVAVPRFPVIVVAAIVMAVVLWLLVRVVFNPLDAKPGG